MPIFPIIGFNFFSDQCRQCSHSLVFFCRSPCFIRIHNEHRCCRERQESKDDEKCFQVAAHTICITPIRRLFNLCHSFSSVHGPASLRFSGSCRPFRAQLYYALPGVTLADSLTPGYSRFALAGLQSRRRRKNEFVKICAIRVPVFFFAPLRLCVRHPFLCVFASWRLCVKKAKTARTCVHAVVIPPDRGDYFLPFLAPPFLGTVAMVCRMRPAILYGSPWEFGRRSSR